MKCPLCQQDVPGVANQPIRRKRAIVEHRIIAAVTDLSSDGVRARRLIEMIGGVSKGTVLRALESLVMRGVLYRTRCRPDPSSYRPYALYHLVSGR